MDDENAPNSDIALTDAITRVTKAGFSYGEHQYRKGWEAACEEICKHLGTGVSAFPPGDGRRLEYVRMHNHVEALKTRFSEPSK